MALKRPAEIDSAEIDKIKRRKKASSATDDGADFLFEETELQYAQLDLLYNGPHSDLTVICRDTMWHVHKSVLSQRCHFFRTISNGHFIEGEANTIKLDDDEPSALATMLEYIYAKVGPSLETFQVNPANVKRAMDVYIIADKYCLTGLKMRATECFLKKPHNWTSVKDEEGVFRVLVDYMFGPDTTGAFSEEIKKKITHSVNAMMVNTDWFESVGKELAASYPNLGEMLIVEGPKLTSACQIQIRLLEAQKLEQNEKIERLRKELWDMQERARQHTLRGAPN